MGEPQTEYAFTLPVGYVDGDGAHHREGTMRLARARDEIEPLRDARVRENDAYLGVLKLARVLTRVGDIEPVTPALVEQLYAADFAHLQSLYEQLNSAPSPPSGQAAALASSPAPGSPPPRPAALAGVSDAALRWMLDSAPQATGSGGAGEVALPVGLVQDRERASAREALMRNPVPPRRGRVLESSDAYTPIPADAAPTRGAPSHDSSAGDAPEHPAEDGPLMRLAARPPASGAPSIPSLRTPAAAPEPSLRATLDDFEDVYEQMIARLRRELLVERERMGALVGE